MPKLPGTLLHQKTNKTEWVLITGASEGIGRALACVFARNGWNAALLARNSERLTQLAEYLQNHYSVQTAVLVEDLSVPGTAARVFEALKNVQISCLVNNAGFGRYGNFADSDLADQTEMMQVNMRVLVELTHLFVRPMLANRAGRILNIASIAAFQPGPTVNMYYATKAFVFSFSYALTEELDGAGVTVTTLCPGLTRTRFFDRAGVAAGSHWLEMSPERVAEIGYRGMMRGHRVVIPGAINRIASCIAKRLPPRLTGFFVRRLHQPRARG